MPPRRARRSTAKVDYASLGKIEGLSDDEPIRGDHDSGSDEFVAPEEDEEEAASEGEVSEGFDEAEEEAEEEALPAEEEDGLDDVVEVAETPKKSTRMFRSSLLIAGKSETPRVQRRSKTESVRERFELFFGCNEERIVQAIQDRKKWGRYPFRVDPGLVQLPKEASPFFANAKALESDQQLSDTAADEERRGMDVKLELSGAPMVELAPGQSRHFDSAASLAVVVNAGAPVSSLAWAPGIEDMSRQYVAIATLDDAVEGGSSDSAVRPNIALFSEEGLRSSIDIYKVDLVSKRSERVARLVHDFGPARNLCWRPCSPESGLPGHLAAVFQDGQVRVLTIDDKLAGTKRIDRPARQYAIKGKITAIAWRTPDVIVAGTADGFICEFDVSDTSEFGTCPSYYAPLHSSIILSIASGFPDKTNLVFTTSTDGFSRLVDLDDPMRARSVSLRMKGYCSSSSYCYHMSSFLALEDASTTKITPIRKVNMSQGGCNPTRHDGTIMSVASSIWHPFVLSGGSEGTVHAGNSVRRTLVSKRQTNATYREAVLWKHEYGAKADIVRLTELLRATDISKHKIVDRQFIYPKQGVVASVDWNPSSRGSGYYAVGFGSGLVLISSLYAASDVPASA